MTIHTFPKPVIPTQRLQQRLPDQITINHGPREQLGRFFLEADKAARDRGVTLSLSTDFEFLDAINRENRPSWHRLVPTFEHHVGGINAQNGFCLFGRNEAGEIVTSQAARVFDFGDETLADYLTSLRLFYPDPDRQKRDGESCTVDSPSARVINRRAVFSGGTWIHPDYRKRLMPMILPRISRALALTRWNTDYTFSLVNNILVTKGVAQAYGYQRVEPGILWFMAPVADRCEASLVWMPRAELLEDLSAFPQTLAAAEERSRTRTDRELPAAVPQTRLH